MDDTKKGLARLILFCLVFCSGLGRAIEMEYVTQEQSEQLASLFSSASFSHKEHASKMSGKSWSCDMYGVRSHLQVQRDVKLYQWSDSKDKVWHNKGAQLISAYKPGPKVLVGQSGRLEDQVKFTPDGRLISQLSAGPLDTAQKVVIAYSVCKSL